MNEALDIVWRRAELVDHVLSAAEIAAWERRQREALINLGLIRRTSDAIAVTCDDCGQSHPAEVFRDPRKPEQPYYLCPDIGRIALAPSDLQRWEVDFDQTAVVIRRAVGLTAKAITLVPSRIWLLGRQQTGDGYWELFLMRGLCWPDGLRLLDQCSRLQQSPAAVVVVPHRLPPGKSAARSWPIRTLSEVATLEGSRLVIDLPSLATAVGGPGISPAPSGKKAPRKRMSRSLGTPEAVQVVTQYLERKQMTDTQFGNQFQTTDKTVRKFINSGKMRRSNFGDMAKSIGLTTEELLRGELPPAIKQPARR